VRNVVAIPLAAVLLAAAGCATAQPIERGNYIERTDAVLADLRTLASDLELFAERIRSAEARYFEGTDILKRRGNPGAAQVAVDDALETLRGSRRELEQLNARAYDLGLRVLKIGDDGVPSVSAVHGPTGRRYTFEDYQVNLEDLFTVLAGVYVQRWEVDELEEDELPPITGRESRRYIEASDKPVFLARGGEETPIRLKELESQGLLRSPHQLDNYLEALDSYIRAFEMRIEGRERVDYYQVTPFRNINKPWVPWLPYEPLLHWTVRVTRNQALVPTTTGGRSSYLTVLEKRLGLLSVRLRDITGEVATARDAFEKARQAEGASGS